MPASQKQQSGTTQARSALKSSSACTVPPVKKSVSFKPRNTMHFFKPDQEDLAERAAHWRQIQAGVQDKRFSRRIFKDIIIHLEEASRGQDITRGDIRRNVLRLQGLACQIAEAKLSDNVKQDIANAFHKWIDDWRLLEGKHQNRFGERLWAFGTLLSTVQQDPSRVQRTCPPDQWSILAPKFRGDLGEDARLFLKRLRDWTRSRHMYELRRPAAWLGLFVFCLGGKAKAWADTNKIVKSTLSPRNLPLASLDGVNLVEALFLERFAPKLFTHRTR